MSGRYAIYYAPHADSALWQRACRWLGRDPESGARWLPPRRLSRAQWQRLVAEPARYGFHATIKPPFHPRSRVSSDELTRQIMDFCARHRPIGLPPLRIADRAGHLVLEPSASTPRLDALAFDCLQQLDHLRAPRGDEHRRRGGHRARMSPRQRELLRNYGYAHCAEHFQFHLTLTSRLSRAQRRQLAPMLRLRFTAAQVEVPPPVDELALFHQAHPRAPFELVHRIPLGAAASSASAARTKTS